MYISKKCKDYDAYLRSEPLLHTTDEDLFVILNDDKGLWKIDLSQENLKINEDESYEMAVRSGSILIKEEEPGYPISCAYTKEYIYWLTTSGANNIQTGHINKYNIKTGKTTETKFKEKINLKLGTRNLIVYKENIIIMEDTGRIVMINNNGEIVWRFLNNEMFSVEKNKDYTDVFGSNTFNNTLIEYNDHIYLTSSYGARIIQIQIGGGNDDWKYLDIDSLKFNICDNRLCTFDNISGMDELTSYAFSGNDVSEGMSKVGVRVVGMFSIGNKLLATIKTDDTDKLVLIDPASLQIKTIVNDIPWESCSITDISNNKTHVFIFSENLYKIPSNIFKRGNFDLKDYCYYDRNTTVIEEEFEF